jgi:hypothetical protein
MAFVEDLTVYFVDFGVTATPDAGTPFTVLFDRAHIEAMGGDISGTYPAVLAASADVSSLVPHTNTLVIAGSDHQPARAGDVQYKIVDIQPDGIGLSTLILEEV